MKAYHFTFLSLFFVELVLCMKIVAPPNPINRRFSQIPKIWLEDYTLFEDYDPLPVDLRFRTQVFENEFISKNGTDYIISEGLLEIVFKCRAKCPIMWTVPFPEVKYLSEYDIRTTIMHASTFNPIGMPLNRYFESLLTIFTPGIAFLSANFTCKPADSGLSYRRQSSIHLFKRGSHAIERQGETIQVPVYYDDSSKDDHFILPCRPATSDLKVILEKQAPNLTYAEIVAPPQYLSFDPKVGFSITKRLLGNNLFGLYRCRVMTDDFPMGEENDDERFVVYIKVTKQALNETGSSKEAEDFKPFSWKEGNATVTVSDHHVWCCSGESGLFPVSVTEYCVQSQCEIKKKVFLEKVKNINEFGRIEMYSPPDPPLDRTDCSVIYLATGFVYCKGGSLEFQEHYISVFSPNIQNVQERTQNETLKYLMRHEAADVAPNLPLERKIFISVGQMESVHKEEVGRSGDYFGPYEDVHQTLYLSNTNDFHINHIYEFNRNHYYEGEQLTFTCFALLQFYAAGIQWKLNWNNGTSTNSIMANYLDAYVYFNGEIYLAPGNNDDAVTQSFSKPLLAHLDMESVECFAPQWSTLNWDVLKYNLDVRPSVLPQISVDQENVYFHLMDKNTSISFDIEGGQPMPKVKVFKDDKLIKEATVPQKNNIINDEDVLSSTTDTLDSQSLMNVGVEEDIINSKTHITIVFPNVIHEVQGVYLCIAENVKGNVTTTINVYVTVRSSIAVPIMVSCTILLGVLLVGIGTWYKCQHSAVQTLRFGIRRL